MVYTLGLGSNSKRVRVQIPSSVQNKNKYIAQLAEQLAFNRKVLGSNPNMLKKKQISILLNKIIFQIYVPNFNKNFNQIKKCFLFAARNCLFKL